MRFVYVPIKILSLLMYLLCNIIWQHFFFQSRTQIEVKILYCPHVQLRWNGAILGSALHSVIWRICSPKGKTKLAFWRKYYLKSKVTIICLILLMVFTFVNTVLHILSLCFIHPIFPFFGFWYFGHFSCMIFSPFFPSRPSCLAKCKKILCNIFVFS